MIAEIIVNSSATELNRVFDYKVPEGYEIGKNIDIGYRVLVSFAFRKQLEIGYIIGFKDTSQYKCKAISKVVDVAFDKTKMEVAKWMSKRYFCNLSDVLKLLVPPGTSNKIDNVKAKTERWVKLTEEFLEVNNSNVEEIKDNTVKTTYENIDGESVIKRTCNKKLIKSEKHQKVVNFLLENKEIPVAILMDVTDVTPAILKTMEKNNIIESFYVEVSRNPFVNKHVKRTEPLNLTEEQKNVMEQIIVGNFGKYLIHGVTGSGKTEIYLQLIEKVLLEGKTAIVLVPEISLTPQITDRFLARFGRIIAILHSKLSQGERYDEWKRIQKGEAKIVIGARSALFAPIQNVGIIIIDEEHDASYKSETTPKYDAREVAEKVAKLNNAILILGSATPDVRTYFKATHKIDNVDNINYKLDNKLKDNEANIKLLELNNRISKNGMPDIEIVDLREELAAGNKTVFSRLLYKEIKKNLEKKEQIILFLNRRGYSTFIMCRDCGYVVKCDKCDVAMTYHMTKNKLLCHYCGEEKSNVAICPDCGGNNIRYFGTGTQKIEAEIHKYFPEASVIRMDVDTTSTKNAHEIILNKFKDEKIDILLGTQMITKGHDFENVTLVGVLAADASINVGDYRANERTYQLLTQVAGRAGRGDKRGRAIIQTYMPDEFSIVTAQKQIYKDFYTNEINVREKLNFPPFCDIIVAVVSGTDEKAVIKDTEQFYNIFKEYFEVYKPVPAPISKINDNYRWRVLLKAKITDEVIESLNYCLDNYEIVRNKENKLNFDINPNNMM